jgi:hypothetical protein
MILNGLKLCRIIKLRLNSGSWQEGTQKRYAEEQLYPRTIPIFNQN